jgi:hypothetical protein
MTKTTTAWLAVLLVVLAMAPTIRPTATHEPTLTLTGCLLLHRLERLFTLEMEYNRIAVLGHDDLPKYVRRRVTLTGVFEERGDQLRFVVDDIAEVAATCDVQAAIPSDTQPHA